MGWSLLDYFPALTLAQRAFAAALIAARPAALILRLPGFAAFATAGRPALMAAQRFFWAAAMRARPAADIPPFLLVGAEAEAEDVPMMDASSFSSSAIRSLIERAFFNWLMLSSLMFVIEPNYNINYSIFAIEDELI